MQRMKALVCRKPGSLVVEERPLPARAADEVLVRIRRIGVCGTDYHIFEGLHPFLEYPRVIGHEIGAEIAEAPKGSPFKPGAPVIVNPYLACGDCIACRKGRPNCCTRIAVLGVHCDGGMCEYLSLPASAIYRADGLSSDQAAMVEFLSIGCHAVRRAGTVAGERALVVGAGPIGIGTAVFARLAGARVALMDRDAARLALAQKNAPGCAAIAADDHAVESVAAATEGDGFDVVFDATGNARAMEKSFDHVAHGGRLVFIGVVKDSIAFNDPDFHRREMQVIGSRNALRADFEQVVAAIRDGQVQTGGLSTHWAPLEDVPQALPRWIAERSGIVKALVTL